MIRMLKGERGVKAKELCAAISCLHGGGEGRCGAGSWEGTNDCWCCERSRSCLELSLIL